MARALRIACFHIPDFPSVAVQRAEGVRGDVIVVQQHRVISCTAGARARGVECGDSSQRAERLAPDALIVLRRYSTELSVWEEVVQTLYTITPHMSELRRGMVALHAVDAHKLRCFAQHYHACVGIASSAITAQLAAFTCDPGSMRFIDDTDVEHFLASASVELLRHFGTDDDCIEKLMLFGLCTLSALRGLSRRQLMAQFGNEGKQLYELVQDLLSDRRSTLTLFQPPEPITAQIQFEQAVREPRELVAALRDAVHSALHELQQQYAQRCCWIGLCLQTPQSRRIYARRILKQASDSIDSIRTAAEILLRSMMDGKECTEMRFELGGLITAVPVQMSCVSETVEPYVIAQKIEKRYPHTMFRAEIRNANAYLAEDRYSLLAYATESLE